MFLNVIIRKSCCLTIRLVMVDAARRRFYNVEVIIARNEFLEEFFIGSLCVLPFLLLLALVLREELGTVIVPDIGIHLIAVEQRRCRIQKNLCLESLASTPIDPSDIGTFIFCRKNLGSRVELVNYEFDACIYRASFHHKFVDRSVYCHSIFSEQDKRTV